MKQCEICQKPIPDDYSNLLCDEHYQSLEAENRRLKELEESQPVPPENVTPVVPVEDISDPNYRANPQVEDKEQWATNVAQFQYAGILLWKPTRLMYEAIKEYCFERVKNHPQYPKFIWKPKIVDVGCGIGLGSNILSQEADMVWGIDKNANSIKFAQQAFSRVKNNIYYSSQLTFDQVDIMEDTRDMMAFDIVVAIEIIEHIADHRGFLERLIKKFNNKANTTEYFISTPNRNNASIHKDKPKNLFHIKEFTQEEFVTVLQNYFENVEILNAKGILVGDINYHTPIIGHCSKAKKI